MLERSKPMTRYSVWGCLKSDHDVTGTKIAVLSRETYFADIWQRTTADE